MNITPLQIKRISTMLSLLNLNEQKDLLVSSFTQGRTISRKEMTYHEASLMITFLQNEVAKDQASANQMRRKIIAKAHNMGWETTPGKVDIERLNAWCRTSSYLKKELNEYTYAELPKLVSQFDNVYKSYLKTRQ